jgi:hypothetical protein
MSNRQNQWEEPPSLTKTLGSISTVVGGMTALFGFLSSILPGLGAPIVALLAGLIISVVLVSVKFWTPQTAVVTWLATSIVVIITFLIFAQPATVTGQVIDVNETPVAGLRLILTNSAGVDQRVVTDQNGNFEVRNVPDGRYTITVESTGMLLSANSVSSGWQRIFTPKENAGGLIYNSGIVNNTPSITPVASVSTATLSPTVTDAPTPVPLTTIPTNTSELLDTPSLIYEEDFEDGEAQDWIGLGGWEVSGAGVNSYLNNLYTAGYRKATYNRSRDWGDVEIEFRTVVSDYLHVYLCEPTSSQNYILNIQQSSNYISFLNYENSGTEPRREMVTLVGGVWQNVRIEIRGQQVTATVSGTTLAAFTMPHCDNEREFGFGTASLARVDDIRVWSLDN